VVRSNKNKAPEEFANYRRAIDQLPACNFKMQAGSLKMQARTLPSSRLHFIFCQ